MDTSSILVISTKRNKRNGIIMDIYNMSHCKDMTAAIAISRADRRSKPKMKHTRHSYRIGDLYRFAWVNGRLTLWRLS